ncbi:YjfB family protein [Azonexus sp.]|uniref:YjfB family protein n=1 Tax=Azonexus sp. TaxID=1872668 RepID=UPI0027B9C460|nr:YjfB family protein [Azonexus sp.]
MSVSDVGGVTSALTAEQTGVTVATKVLKKAIEIEEQNAMQLLQALPQPSNPPNLGNAVDVKA